MLRNLLFRAYWKAEKIIAPGLTSSQVCYYNKLKELVPGKDWLDLGCGHQVFADWMTREQAEVIASSKRVYGIDLDWTGLKAHREISNKVFGDLVSMPFENASFDLVSANMVAEHLPEPRKVLSEVRRVLRPGGRFIFHTPNFLVWTIQVAARVPDGLKKRLIRLLEARREEDVFHTFYRMNTQGEIQQLAREMQFDIEDITMVSTSAATAMLGPVVWAELLYIRSLRKPNRAKYRSNIVTTLRKAA
jgi:ubiquinone/menaquinone biosynthesis C-methylase UbiE